MIRKHRGQTNHAFGALAEDRTADWYKAQGALCEQRRWRGKQGEIDLIHFLHGQLIFTEVKASKTLNRAAASLSERQTGRILRAAEEYLSATGRSLDTNIRVDVALYDLSGTLDIIENALTQ